MHQRSPIASIDAADVSRTVSDEVSADTQDSLPPSKSDSGKKELVPCFAPGDLVAITQNGINCRAWMSSVAPVRCQLDKDARATVLSEPFRFGNHFWSKVRIEESGIEGCLATRCLELVERTPTRTVRITSSIEAPVRSQTEYQAGDLMTTGARLNLRNGPGLDRTISQVIAANTPGILVGPPVMQDDLSWIPVRFSAATGWISAKHSHFLNRNGKWIEVDLSAQTLQSHTMHDSTRSFVISSGKATHSTPTGTFAITKKLPVRLLSGTVREESWRIPGVPWIMVFRSGGFYIHAAYWHTDFGNAVSHGCVTLAPDDAEWLYDWTPLDTPVWIHG